MLTFNHSGKIGDLLYSLYFCRSIAEMVKEEKFDFNIRYDTTQSLHSRQEKNIRLTKENAESIKSLLEIQPYINNVTVSNKEFITDKDKQHFNLDSFRKFKINFSSGEIPEWYYNLICNSLERHFDEQILFVEPDKNLEKKIIISRSKKYINPLVNLKVLEPYKDLLVFIGLDDEYKLFCKDVFEIPRYEVKNCLEIAQAIQGADLTISNQNGNFAIAELMKVNRMLIPAQYEAVLQPNGDVELHQGPCNVVCHGGWYEYINYTTKLEYLMKTYYSNDIKEKENKNE